MIYIPQKQLENLKKYVSSGKAVIIYGPRRCGKTTLLEHFQKAIDPEKTLSVTGDDLTVREYLSSQSLEKLTAFLGEKEYLIVDEAQRIPDIGLNLKIIVDHLKHVNVIATGSSSFDLARHIGEPLTGRKTTLMMFPLSQMELSSIESRHVTDDRLESRLIYGSYPQIILQNNDALRKEILKEIVSSYLMKDILELDHIRHSDKLVRLLQCLAFQIGKEVSMTELGTQLSMSKNTVDRYLDLLEKTFVIFRLTGLSRNLRKEITKNHRYYFTDNGIRNALINGFNPLTMRNDIGMLWENYIVGERIKRQAYVEIFSNNYFWRTYDQKEIDFVEERDGKLFGYEMKWDPKKKKEPDEWKRAYPESEFQVIHRENYLDFIT